MSYLEEKKNLNLIGWNKSFAGGAIAGNQNP